MTDAIPGEPPVAGVVKTSAVEPASSTMTDSGNVAVAARDHAHAQQNDVVTEPQATTTTTTATTTTTTASIPNILPLGGDVHPDHQAEVLKDAPDHLVEAQIEKTAEAAREHHGLPEQGTIIPGFEDSKLWAMRRRFDAVSDVRISSVHGSPSARALTAMLGELALDSKSCTYYLRRPNCLRDNLTCVRPPYRTFPSTRT